MPNDVTKPTSMACSSFLRYLHRQRILLTDLSRAIPRRRGYRQTTVPRAITWAEVERVLGVVDRPWLMSSRERSTHSVVRSRD